MIAVFDMTDDGGSKGNATQEGLSRNTEINLTISQFSLNRLTSFSISCATFLYNI
jgi:hypothetical protein